MKLSEEVRVLLDDYEVAAILGEKAETILACIAALEAVVEAAQHYLVWGGSVNAHALRETLVALEGEKE